MVQYKIPQNVGIEDKIVGPFSLRQLIILAVGGGISYTIFAISSRFYELNVLEYIIILLPALIALAGALIKINHVSFFRFLLLLLESSIRPQKRHWDHQGIAALVDPDLSDKRKLAPVTVSDTEVGTKKDVNLRKLSVILDSGGYQGPVTTHEDLDTVKDDDLITQAYFGNKRKGATAENMYWRTRDVQKKKLDWLAKMPKATPSTETEKGAQDNPASKEATTPSVKSQKPTEPKPRAEIEPLNMKDFVAPSPKPNPASESEEKIPSKPKREQEEVKLGSDSTPKAEQKEVALESDPSPKGNGAPQKQEANTEAPKKKRRRRRRRKKKTSTPVRQSPVNTLTPSQKPFSTPEKPQNIASLDDLEAGQTIEFNLD